MTARVLLMRLAIRESAKGTSYLSGYLGCARVIAFRAKEPDRYGNEQWEVYVAEAEPKDGQQRSEQPGRGQSTWDRSRDHDLPTGETKVYRNEPRRASRQEYVDELARRFDERGPDEEPGF
jgi:hypothetical protein